MEIINIKGHNLNALGAFHAQPWQTFPWLVLQSPSHFRSLLPYTSTRKFVLIPEVIHFLLISVSLLFWALIKEHAYPDDTNIAEVSNFSKFHRLSYENILYKITHPLNGHVIN